MLYVGTVSIGMTGYSPGPGQPRATLLLIAVEYQHQVQPIIDAGFTED
jgi:hypothetical protein